MCVIDNLTRGQVLQLAENVATKGRHLHDTLIVHDFFTDRSFIAVRLPDQPGRECLALKRNVISECYKLKIA